VNDDERNPATTGADEQVTISREELVWLVMEARQAGYQDARQPVNDTMNRCRAASEAMINRRLART
jgi:hypothetical protein